MALDKDIKTFCRNSGTFSIPLIQLKFSVTYKEAARVVDELVGASRLFICYRKLKLDERD